MASEKDNTHSIHTEEKKEKATMLPQPPISIGTKQKAALIRSKMTIKGRKNCTRLFGMDPIDRPVGYFQRVLPWKQQQGGMFYCHPPPIVEPVQPYEENRYSFRTKPPKYKENCVCVDCKRYRKKKKEYTEHWGELINNIGTM